MSVTYNTHDSGGDASGNHKLYIYVYPDDTNDDSVVQDSINPGLAKACKEAYNNSSVIDYWEVAFTDDHPNVWDSGDDKTDALDKFGRNDGRDGKSDDSYLANMNDVPVGTHLLVDNNRYGGVADGGDCSSQGDDERQGWTDWSPAVYGSKGDSGDFQQCIAIQEAFHNLIDKCVNGVSTMISGNCGEHDLGHISYFGKVTPLLASYETDSDCTGSGDCQTSETHQEFTTDLTNCTIEALGDTANHYI